MVRRPDDAELRGELQAELMRIVWRLGEVTVDQARAAQPSRGRCAYTTVQTVLNRLVDRGLLTRRRRGRAFVYKAAYTEPELVARSIGERLADASADARRTAMLNLVEGLGPEELEEVALMANRIRRERQRE